jgi:hypothetical protein
VLLSLHLDQAPPVTRDAFLRLVIQRLETETFGKAADQAANSKPPKTLHELGNSSWIMARVGKKRPREGDADGGAAEAGPSIGGLNGHAKGGLLKALQKAVRKEEESDDGGEGSEAEESDGGVAVQKQTPEEAAREKQER